MINIDKNYYNYSGIYIIYNHESNRVYVGSAISIGKRIKQHRNSLNKNVHRNIYLQNAYNKYGEDKFNVMILEILFNKNVLLKREQYYINIYKNIFNHAYNINPTAGSSFGYKHTLEMKAHLSEGKMGINNPQYGNVGIKNPNHKLTIENIYYIRNNSTNFTSVEMGRMFGVAYQTINDIKRNKTWKNI